jgi:hypothetical protein
LFLSFFYDDDAMKFFILVVQWQRQQVQQQVRQVQVQVQARCWGQGKQQHLSFLEPIQLR